MKKKILFMLVALALLIGLAAIPSNAGSYPDLLEVTKTVKTSLTRTYHWDITKWADPNPVDLLRGETADVQYWVRVNDTGFTDSNWYVWGNIDIDNNTDGYIEIDDVVDRISGVSGEANVNCTENLPYVLGPWETLTCEYSAYLPNGLSRTNTATVYAEEGDYEDTSPPVNVTFSSAYINEINESVNVYDSYIDDYLAEEVSYEEAPMTYTYLRTIGPYSACGVYEVENEAIVETWYGSLLDEASSTVYVHVEPATICVVKFYDANGNGVWDISEPWLAGWPINIYDEEGALVTTLYTSDEVGNPACIEVAPGNYTVTEVVPPGWVATTPTSKTFTVGCGGDQDVYFSNVCLGAGGGLGIGFWSNSNGQALVNSSDLTFLRSLCLRDARGRDFNPTSKTALKSWLLSAQATNMAYMLSAQLAAMELNVRHGFVNGASFVWTGTQGITINNLMAEAAAALCLDGNTPVGDTNRAYQDYLQKALEAANKNLNFINPTPCPLPD